MATFSNAEIAKYYDLSKTHYEKFWGLKRSRSLHYGYWDRNTNNFHEALLNTNNILAKTAGIKPSQRVLDAGCGIGGSSLWLAKNIGCRVMGISLSEKQIAAATALAESECLQNLVSFLREDFCATGFADATFDVVWAVESVCHAVRKRDFINEAYRVLKPGGKLILADFFQKPDLSVPDRTLMQDWAHGWAIGDFAETDRFTNELSEAGFADVAAQNATKHIQRSARRLNRAYFPGKIGGFIYRLFNPKATDIGKKNIDTARLQYRALKKQLWTYEIISARKG